jgi:hypothetical protein
VRNLPSSSIEVTCLGVSSYCTTPQEACGYSKPADWEPIVLAYNRKLVVPGNLGTKMTFYL